MKAKYVIPVKDCQLPYSGQDTTVLSDGVTVSWESSEEHLMNVIIQCPMEVLIDDNGVLQGSYPALEAHAFKIFHFVANRVLFQTGIDISGCPFSPGSPQLVPDSPEEDSLLHKGTKIRVTGSLSIKVIKILNPDSFAADYAHSRAYGYFSDASRSLDPFIRYKQLFSVLEYYFGGKGAIFDRAASNHTVSLNQKYDASFIEKLRSIRNRCTHPRAIGGHLNPENMQDRACVHSWLSELESLVKRLVESPPQ